MMGWFKNFKKDLEAERLRRAWQAERERELTPNDSPMTLSDKVHVRNFRRGVAHLVYVANASYKSDKQVLKTQIWCKKLQLDLIRLASSGSYVEPMNEIVEAALTENKDNERAVSALEYLRRP